MLGLLWWGTGEAASEGLGGWCQGAGAREGAARRRRTELAAEGGGAPLGRAGRGGPWGCVWLPRVLAWVALRQCPGDSQAALRVVTKT